MVLLLFRACRAQPQPLSFTNLFVKAHIDENNKMVNGSEEGYETFIVEKIDDLLHVKYKLAHAHTHNESWAPLA